MYNTSLLLFTLYNFEFFTSQVHFIVSWPKGRCLSQFESLLRQVFKKARKYLTLRAVRQRNLTFVCTAPQWVRNMLKGMIMIGETVLSRVRVMKVTIEGEPVFQEVKHPCI